MPRSLAPYEPKNGSCQIASVTQEVLPRILPPRKWRKIQLKVHRLKAMGSGDTNTLSRLKPTFAAAQTAAFRRRSFGGSGPFGTS